jgi:hypothetical protein
MDAMLARALTLTLVVAVGVALVVAGVRALSTPNDAPRPVAIPTLRVLACSGTFDRSTGHQRDDTVVFASAQ